MKITQEEYLEHFGVLGMKWGRRKAGSPASVRKKARLEAKSQKLIKQLEGDKASEQNMINEHYAAKVNKLKKEYEAIESNKKFEKDIIKEDYAGKIKDAKSSGKSTKELTSKMNKELDDTDKYWDEQLSTKIRATTKQAQKAVSELALNKAYWDKQIEDASSSKIQKEELKYGLSVAATALLIVGGITMNYITMKNS